MKGIFKRGLALALCLVACFSAAACKDEKKSSKGNKPVSTGEYVVSEGKSDYQILMPAERDENIDVAVSDLQLGIEAATGYKMTTTTHYVEGRKYLSVGETALYEANKAAVDGDKLEDFELRVLTVDDDVIMIGGETEYTTYAVYEFMERSFGFKWYTYEDYYVKETDAIELFKLDVTEKPVLTMRVNYKFNFEDEEEGTRRSRRMRVHSFQEFHFITAGHNMIGTVIPKSVYATEHPEWFSKPTGALTYTEAGQLCVTNEALIAEFIKRTKELILQNWGDGSNRYFMIGMEDAWDNCTCKTCTEREQLYGNQAGVWIEFANKVSRAINEWVKTIDPDKTIYFPMYAYFFTEEAPVKEENGKYVPTHENVIPDEEVLMMYAPLNNSFAYSFNDPRNTKTYATLERWEAVTDNMILYSYGYSGKGFLPMNDLLTLGGTMYRAETNNYFGWIEENGTTRETANMVMMKDYIRSQLWWGTDKSVDELAYEFIDFYYAPVAKEFKSFYADLVQWQTYQMEVIKPFVSVQGTQYSSNVECWPIGKMDGFNAAVESLLAGIEPLKENNPALYEQYFHRINREKIWIYWQYCSLHQKYFGDDKINEMVDFLEQYMLEYRIANNKHLSQLEGWRR